MAVQSDLEALAGKATVVLRRRLGTDVSLVEPTHLKSQSRGLVMRCSVVSERAHGDVPASVVIKHIRDDAPHGFSDWAGLAFLSDSAGAQGLAPRFLGGDASERFFVMEDFGTSRSLEDVLTKGSADTVTSALRSLATAMARLHGATLAMEDGFDLARRALPEMQGLGRGAEAALWLENQNRLAEWFRAVDCDVPPGFAPCLERIARVYVRPGPFLCFTHGDPAPSNNHVSDACVRLLDFEYGGFRHALYDLTGWNILCPLPSDCVEDMNRHFRQALAPACPAVLDEARYADAWATLCAFRALSMLTWIRPDILKENRPWVGETWTCRHAVLAALSRLQEATDEVATLGPIHEAAAKLGATLQLRWPEIGDRHSLTPPWPAFARRRSH